MLLKGPWAGDNSPLWTGLGACHSRSRPSRPNDPPTTIPPAPAPRWMTSSWLAVPIRLTSTLDVPWRSVCVRFCRLAQPRRARVVLVGGRSSPLSSPCQTSPPPSPGAAASQTQSRFLAIPNPCIAWANSFPHIARQPIAPFSPAPLRCPPVLGPRCFCFCPCSPADGQWSDPHRWQPPLPCPSPNFARFGDSFFNTTQPFHHLQPSTPTPSDSSRPLLDGLLLGDCRSLSLVFPVPPLFAPQSDEA